MSNRILLVEDHPDVRETLAEVLRENGYRVKDVEDGEIALACLRRFTYAAVVTDLKMPKVDGLEVVREAQARKIPALIITAHVTPETPKYPTELLTKPFRMEDLFHWLERQGIRPL